MTGTMHSNNIFQSDLLVYSICYQARSNLQALARAQLLSYLSPKAPLKKKNNPLMEISVTKFKDALSFEKVEHSKLRL